jgi:hypothetical protein
MVIKTTLAKNNNIETAENFPIVDLLTKEGTLVSRDVRNAMTCNIDINVK